MQLNAGAIAYWREFEPGRDKFIYILGKTQSGEVLSFTISSQEKYLKMEPHKNEMVEIPRGTANYLERRSFIQCFFEVIRTPIVTFQDFERRGYINWRGQLPQFLAAVKVCVNNSELLSEYDREDVLAVMAGAAGDE